MNRFHFYQKKGFFYKVKNNFDCIIMKSLHHYFQFFQLINLQTLLNFIANTGAINSYLICESYFQYTSSRHYGLVLFTVR